MNLKAKQRGISGVEILVVAVLAAIVLLVVFKTLPAITEARAVQDAIDSVASEAQRNSAMTRNQISEAFGKRATINDISSISGKDLQVERKAGVVSIHAKYERKVPLFGNMGFYFEYDLTSK